MALIDRNVHFGRRVRRLTQQSLHGAQARLPMRGQHPRATRALRGLLELLQARVLLLAQRARRGARRAA